MARKKSEEAGGESSWMNTYADMVTLLLTFFAVLLSMSTINEEKFQALVDSLQEKAPEVIEQITNLGPGNGGPGQITEGNIGNMTDLYEAMKTYVNENGLQSDVQLTLKDEVLFIKFNSSVIFEPDKYRLKPQSIPILDSIASALVQFKDNIKMLNVYGHTAKVSAAEEDNYSVSSWMLSCERAGAVARFLTEDKEFDPNKLVAMGYGSTRPIGDNKTPQGREENRRVELVVIGINSDISTNVYDQLEEYFDGALYPTTGGASDILGLDDAYPGGEPETGETTNTEAPAPSQTGDVEANVSPYDDQ